MLLFFIILRTLSVRNVEQYRRVSCSAVSNQNLFKLYFICINSIQEKKTSYFYTFLYVAFYITCIQICISQTQELEVGFKLMKQRYAILRKIYEL